MAETRIIPSEEFRRQAKRLSKKYKSHADDLADFQNDGFVDEQHNHKRIEHRRKEKCKILSTLNSPPTLNSKPSTLN